MKDKEKVKILEKALEDILETTKLDGEGRRAFSEKYKVSGTLFYPCAVGHIQSIAEFALSDVKGE
ncbi:MAG: hypothetical protein LUG99_00185 [Lachnospiraceae bacterium]|nr:hypothetical protein [Lachnospiraceae bacterium]